MPGKASMKPGSGIADTEKRGSGALAKTLLTMVGVGIAGGAALIGGGAKLGNMLLNKQASDYEKLEAQREADRQSVRDIMENEIGFGEDPGSDD